VENQTLVRRNLIANYLGSAWNALMALLFIPLYINYLGMEAYGLIGVFAVLQTSMIVLDMGLVSTLNREMARFRGGAHTPQSIREVLSTLQIIFMLMALLISCGVWLLSPSLSYHWLQVQQLPISTVSEALAVAGAVIALSWLASLYAGAITGLQQLVWLNAVRSTFATLRGVGVIAVLIWISPTIKAFFIFQGVVALAEALVLGMKVHRFLPPAPNATRFSKDALLKIWRFSAGLTVHAILALFLTQVDKILLSTLLSLKDFGYFALAGVVAGSLFAITFSINSVAYPRMTEAVARGADAELVRIYHQFCQLMSVLVIPATLVLSFFADHILLLWTRDEELTSHVATLVSLLVVGNMMSSLMYIPYLLTLAYGWTRFMILAHSTAILIMVPIIVWGVIRFGVIAAPITWIMVTSGYLLFAIPLMHKRLLPEEKWHWYSQDVGLPALGALCPVGLVAMFAPAPRADAPIMSVFIILLAAVLSLATATLAAPRVRRQAIDTFSCINALAQKE